MNASGPNPLRAPLSAGLGIQRVPPGHIPRSSLQQRLLAQDARLRLLVAPAGYGKTVLMADCARACPVGYQVLWLNCPGTLHEPAHFVWHLNNLLGYSSEWSADVLLTQLGQESRQLWIMLNDYPAQPNHLLDTYLDQILSQSSATLRWWLGSRRRPACNLPRLLLEGDLLEVSANELLFSSEETAVWIRNLDPERESLAHQLYTQTRGWPAALRLRLLSIQGDTAARSVTAADQQPQVLIDYMEREVLHALPAELRQMLQQLAHLPRFNAALCEHLFGAGEGAQWLRELIDRGVFIQEDETSRGWYNVFAPLAHLLVQLPQMLSGSTLHVHASQWFASHGDTHSAIEHALLAGQPEVAGSFLEHFTEEQILQGQDLGLILRWRNELPDTLLYSTPRLVTLNAWVLVLVGRLDEAQACVDQLARFQPCNDPGRMRELFAQWQAIHGIIAFGLVCAMESRTHLLEALEGLSDDAWAPALLCRSILTLIAIGEGDLAAAQKLSFAALREARQLSKPVFEAWLELDHALLLEARGEFARAESLLQRVLGSTSQTELLNTLVLPRIQLRLGRLILRQNRPVEARHWLRSGLDNALQCGDPIAFHGYLGLAELAMGKGDIAGAFACLAEAERQMQRQRVSEPLYRGTLLLASSHLWIAQGHFARAREAVTRVLGYERRVKAILPTPNFPELIPRLQALLLRLDREQGQDVREPLQRLIEQVTAQGRQALASELWLSYADACMAIGEHSAAEHARQKGQSIAQRIGYERVWFALAEPAPGPAHTLSSRELAVLRLIAQGMSNQEVAEQLFISLHTVKTHARRINGKLGVARRTQAVAKAKALGFF